MRDKGDVLRPAYHAGRKLMQRLSATSTAISNAPVFKCYALRAGSVYNRRNARFNS